MSLHALVVAFVVTSAAPSDEQVARRIAAAVAAFEAWRGGDGEGLSRCAELSRALAQDLAPGHERLAVVLQNAATCYVGAGRDHEAMGFARRVVAEFPRSHHAVTMLGLISDIERVRGQFEAAAATIEEAARRGPRRVQRHTLELAGQIRLGLGQDTLADADLSLAEAPGLPGFELLHAQRFWERGRLAYTTARRIDHAREYLRRHGATGGPALRLLAEATVGLALWDMSCGTDLAPGETCPRARWTGEARLAERRAALAGQVGELRGVVRAPCSTWFGAPWVPPRRDPKLAAQARRHLVRARELAGELRPEDHTPEVRQVLFGVEVALLEPELERLLEITVPNALRLYPDRSLAGSDEPADRRLLARQRLEAAHVRRRIAAATAAVERGARLQARFAVIARSAGPGPVARAAWLRAGIVSDHITHALRSREPTGGFPDAASARRYCEERAADTRAHELVARSSYARCVADGPLDAAAMSCAQRRAALWPREFPPDRELFDRPEHGTSRPISFAIQLEAPDSAPAR